MNNQDGYRVVVVLSTGISAPYIMEDYASALETMGHEVLRFDTRPIVSLPPSEQSDAIREFKQKVKEFSPHFALGYGVNSLIPIPAADPDSRKGHLFEALGIPYGCLNYDSPFYNCTMKLMSPWAGSRLCTVFIWDRYYVELFRNQVGPAHYLPLGTNPERFHSVLAEEELAADAVFIGTIAENADFAGQRRAQGWDAALMEIARTAVASMRTSGGSLDNALNIIFNEIGSDFRAAFSEFIKAPAYDAFLASVYGEVGYFARREAVASLAPIKVRVHGGPGWKTMDAAHVNVQDPVAYNDAPRVYCSAKINLNVSSAQLVTSINQRVFDVPACGAFILTDMREDAARLFTPDEEIVIYEDLQDLKKKADYYLEYEDERLQIAVRGRERILREHTYVHRAKTVIDVLKSKGLIT